MQKVLKVIEDKTAAAYLSKYPDIPWKEIMGLRDIIAHEYHRIDEEEIFNVMQNDLVPLLKTIRRMKRELFEITEDVVRYH